jgi:hypothetical protein
MWFMEQQQTSPQPPALPTTRHDGWTGEKMAMFCEALAETAVVAEACEIACMGISGAYAARRRNPVFAAAWDASLTIARERLADTLLGRAMEGNIEQIYKDGELVGERHVLDNRLGLAILRRLDRLAETGLSLHTNPSPFPGDGRGPGARRSAHAIVPRASSFDWATAVEALRTGDDEAVAVALALVDSNKVEEVEDPLNRSPSCAVEEREETSVDLSHRCWKDKIDDIWMTDFPPPEGFTGYESRPYEDLEDEEPYVRVCTPREAAILDADRAADVADFRAGDDMLRDRWFEFLKDNAAASGWPAAETSDTVADGRS